MEQLGQHVVQVVSPERPFVGIAGRGHPLVLDPLAGQQRLESPVPIQKRVALAAPDPEEFEALVRFLRVCQKLGEIRLRVPKIAELNAAT